MAEDTKSNLTILQISPKRRAEDRFISSRVNDLTYGSQELKLVCVVEIVNHWNHAREIGSSLAQTFVHYFNQSQHHSVLTRFEDALKQMNKLLINASAKVGTTISCVLALHNDKDIYFSTVGKIKIILIRDGKLTSAIADRRDEQNEFTSVTSGSLGENDWIIYTSEELFTIARKIKPVAKTFTAGELEEQLRQLSSVTNPTALIGCAVEYREGVDTEGTISLDEAPDRLNIKLPQVSFDMARFMSNIGTSISAIFAKGVALFKKRKDKEMVVEVERDEPDESEMADDEIEEAPVAEAKKEFTVSHYEPKTKNKFGNSSVARFFEKIFRYVRHPLTAGIIFVIILAGISYFGYQNYKNHNTASAPAPAPKTPALISSLSSASPEQARTLLASGLTQDRYQVFSTSDQKTLADLATKAGVTIAQLPAQPLFKTDSDIAQIAVTPRSNYVYAIDKTGQLWFWDGKQIAKMTQANLIAQPVSITAMAKNEVLVSDALNDIYLFNGSDTQPVKLTQPTGWTTGPRYLQNYNANLYVLTTNDGIVHRIPGFIDTIANDTALGSKVVAPTDKILNFLIPGDVVTLTPTSGLVDHPRTTPAATLVMPADISASASATFTKTSYEVNDGSLISTYNLTGAFQSANAYILSNPINQIADNSPQGLLIVIGSNVYETK